MSQILNAAIIYYGAHALPALRAMDGARRAQLVSEINRVCGVLPLHTVLTQFEKKQLAFPTWEGGKELSGPQTMALMVFCVWVQVGENPDNCPWLMESWPIREAVALAGTRQK